MKQNKALTIVGWILTLGVSGMLLMSAFFKFAATEEMVKAFTEQFGFPLETLRPIAIAEVASVLFFLIPQTRVLGAILITGYLGGAIVTHVRLADYDITMPILLGVGAWLALFFRDERVRQLAPITWPNTPSEPK